MSNSDGEGSIEFASVGIAEPNPEPEKSIASNSVRIAELDPEPEEAIAPDSVGIAEPEPNSDGTRAKKGWQKFLEHIESRLGNKDKTEWLNEMRGSLSLAASIIATMSFQLAVNPPGGVVQVGVKDTISIMSCRDNHIGSSPCPGHAVLGILYPGFYLRFLVCNTISFIASLSVCLLLVSGLSLKHPVQIWLLCIGMCITITSLALTYFLAASMVTPDNIWDTTNSIINVVLYVWVSLLAVIAFVLIIRLLVWLVNKFINKRNE